MSLVLQNLRVSLVKVGAHRDRRRPHVTLLSIGPVATSSVGRAPFSSCETAWRWRETGEVHVASS